MKRLTGILGGFASLYAIGWLLFFGDDLSSTDIARIGVAALAGAILSHGTRRIGKPPWVKHGGPGGKFEFNIGTKDDA